MGEAGAACVRRGGGELRRRCGSDRRSDGARLLNDAGELLLRDRENGGLVENVAHFSRHAAHGHGFEPFAMDARILIFIFDLATAILDRGGAAALRAFLAQRDEGLASAAETAGQIARRLAAGVEVLVEHPERRHIHNAVTPWNFGELFVAFIPEQRIAFT